MVAIAATALVAAALIIGGLAATKPKNEQTYKQNKVLGQGAREADNYSNVVGNLASAWTDAMGKMGEKALPNVTEALQDLANWITNNPLVFETLGSWFGEITSLAGDAAIAVMSFAEQVSVAAEKNGWAGAIDTLVGKEGYTSNIVDKWTTMRDVVKGKDESATIGDVVDAIADAALSLVGKELNIPEATLPQPNAYDKQVLFDQYGNRLTGNVPAADTYIETFFGGFLAPSGQKSLVFFEQGILCFFPEVGTNKH